VAFGGGAHVKNLACNANPAIDLAFAGANRALISCGNLLELGH
jgi:hypothetical protein